MGVKMPSRPLYSPEVQTWRLALAGALVAIGLVGCSSRQKASELAAHNVTVFHLKPGDCVSPPTDIKAEISQVKVVSCSAPHSQEVFALVPDTKDETYPGETALQTYASGVCVQQFAAYVGIDYRDSTLFYTFLLPSARGWESVNDRTITCLIETTGAALTTSVKGSKR
jgi:hypothetical protein